MITFLIWWGSIGFILPFLYTFVYHRGIKSMVDQQVFFCKQEYVEEWQKNRGFFSDLFFFVVLVLFSTILIYPTALKVLRDMLHYALVDPAKGNKKE